MKSVPTFWANIYVGFLITDTKDEGEIGTVRYICGKYVDSVGLCMTITPTEFRYTDGGEYGAVVGLINYPRFPSTNEEIKNHAIILANRLKEGLGQNRVSIVMPDETIMLGE